MSSSTYSNLVDSFPTFVSDFMYLYLLHYTILIISISSTLKENLVRLPHVSQYPLMQSISPIARSFGLSHKIDVMNWRYLLRKDF